MIDCKPVAGLTFCFLTKPTNILDMRIIQGLVSIITALFVGISAVSAEESTSLVGEWKIFAEKPQGGGTAESTMTIEKKDEKFVGVGTTEDGQEMEISSATINGKKVEIDFGLDYNGQDITIRIKAEESESGKLAGRWLALDAEGTEYIDEAWKAERTSAPAPEEKAEPRDGGSIVGKWNAKSTTDNGDLASVVTFTKDGEKFKGNSKSEQGSLDFDSVSVEGKEVEIELTLDYEGTDIPVTIRAEQTDEDHLKGMWLIFDASGQEAASGEWEAERALMLDLAGKWNVVAATDDGDLEFQSVFERTESGYKGTSETNDGSMDYKSIDVSDNEVKLGLPFGDGSVKIEASYTEKNKLTGKWHYFENSDTEAASGDWAASKVVEEVKMPTVVGEWAIEIDFGQGEPRDYTLKISEEDDALGGVFISPRSGETKCDSVNFKEATFGMKVTREVQSMDIEFVYKGKLKDDQLSGTVVPTGYEDQFSGTWTGKRK